MPAECLLGYPRGHEEHVLAEWGAGGWRRAGTPMRCPAARQDSEWGVMHDKRG